MSLDLSYNFFDVRYLELQILFGTMTPIFWIGLETNIIWVPAKLLNKLLSSETNFGHPNIATSQGASPIHLEDSPRSFYPFKAFLDSFQVRPTGYVSARNYERLPSYGASSHSECNCTINYFDVSPLIN